MLCKRTSRPVVLGGGILRYSCASMRSSNGLHTLPVRAKEPLSSNACASVVTPSTRAAAMSMNTLPGPVSNASGALDECGCGTNVTLPMPPVAARQHEASAGLRGHLTRGCMGAGNQKQAYLCFEQRAMQLHHRQRWVQDTTHPSCWLKVRLGRPQRCQPHENPQ
jgi:hypothetical protein